MVFGYFVSKLTSASPATFKIHDFESNGSSLPDWNSIQRETGPMGSKYAFENEGIPKFVIHTYVLRSAKYTLNE